MFPRFYFDWEPDAHLVCCIAMISDAQTTLVIGAGVAGLVAAIELHRAGKPVLVVEAAPEVGGRVRTTVRDGFRLDHGFQVLFTAYPVLNEYLDHRALKLHPFQPAARIVRDGGRTALVGDALNDLSLLLPSLTGGALPVPDLLRLLRLRQLARRLTVDECFAAEHSSVSTRDFLKARGFSANTINGFFAPFYGGILLDRTLTTRASVLLFTFKMLAEGKTAVPEGGMGAITAQMAKLLPIDVVRCNTRVRALNAENGRVVGATLDDGTLLDARDVVLATDLITAHALTESIGAHLNEPRQVLGCTTVYYSAASAVLPGRALWLNARRDATVSHAITLTEVVANYAPRGQHLIAATVLGDAATHDDTRLDAAVRNDLARMAPGATADALDALTRLAIWRVPFSQYAQPVLTSGTGVPASARTAIQGLWRASETAHSSSLDGAARGGQLAARELLIKTGAR